MHGVKGAYQISKDDLLKYVEQGLSLAKIEEITGIRKYSLHYYCKKYNITDKLRYGKNNLDYVEDFFHTIDTKEKAYCLGFLLGDGCIDKEGRVEVSVALRDKEILDFIVSCCGGRVRTDERVNLNKKQFPSASIKIGNKKMVRDIGMLFGGRLKQERHIPIIKKHLEPFLLQGFFDAEGCVSYGTKNSGQKWKKVTFTSQLRMLEGIQRILLKNDIPSAIRPKGKEKCYVMEVRNTEKILKIADLIYSNRNFVVLHRKYDKLMALRLELGENGEGHNGE